MPSPMRREIRKHALNFKAGKIAMNKENNVSEYKIGRTTYIVTLVFNPASKEHLTDILQRLINRECEEMLGESGQEPEKQAV
ncbi:transposon-encoded TnpW family protein [Ruminococcus albus]|nr:transposon-encoded TnpW family protein [Ruminococcus albus]